MLSVNDLIKDYDAVMWSAAHLKGSFGPASTWPYGLTLEDDLVDLGWHQREFPLGRSFAYTMMSPDEAFCLGCCYIYPSEKAGYDAKAYWWGARKRPELWRRSKAWRGFPQLAQHVIALQAPGLPRARHIVGQTGRDEVTGIPWPTPCIKREFCEYLQPWHQRKVSVP